MFTGTHCCFALTVTLLHGAKLLSDWLLVCREGFCHGKIHFKEEIFTLDSSSEQTPPSEVLGYTLGVILNKMKKLSRSNYEDKL